MLVAAETRDKTGCSGQCSRSGSYGGVSNSGCGIGGSGGSSGCLASSLDLMLLVNNMNNTIPTQ